MQRSSAEKSLKCHPAMAVNGIYTRQIPSNPSNSSPAGPASPLYVRASRRIEIGPWRLGRRDRSFFFRGANCHRQRRGANRAAGICAQRTDSLPSGARRRCRPGRRQDIFQAGAERSSRSAAPSELRAICSDTDQADRQDMGERKFGLRARTAAPGLHLFFSGRDQSRRGRASAADYL